MTRPHEPTAPKGFVLPVTIMAIAGLLILVVALLTFVALERKTARSYSDAARADLAAESAIAEAVATLSTTVLADDSLVFRIDDPTNPTVPANAGTPAREQFFTYGALFDPAENGWRVLPFFSGAPASLHPTAGRPDSATLRQSLASLTGDLITIGRLGPDDFHVPRGKWIHVQPENSQFSLRYAWWIEDLGGRLDGRHAGSEPRGPGRSPAEFGLFSLLNPNAQAPPSRPDEPERALLDRRGSLRTPASTRLVLEETDARRVTPYLIYPNESSLAYSPRKLIPHGFGYPDAGRPAMDLNEAIRERDVEGIAAHIRRNLPRFATRAGALSSEDDYLKTLAASIIDYADEDNEPTLGEGYRGIDSYPFVNGIFDRYLPVAPEPSRPTQIAIQVRTFVELWNPSNQTISGRLRFHNINRVGVTAGGVRRFTPVMLEPAEETITLAPNEHKVVEFLNDGQPMVYRFDSNIAIALPYTLSGATDNNFELYWNDFLVDAARLATPGLARAGGSPSAQANPNSAYLSGNLMPIFPADGAYGDPRATWYLRRSFSAANYESNSCWGGRNRLSTINVEMRLDPGPTLAQAGNAWPDRGADSPLGLNPGSRSLIPGPTGLVNATSGQVQRQYPANRPEMAPSRISNAGRLRSLTELGHIFDPAQWKNINRTDASPSPTGGGGITLAVGRPEYKPFDAEGLRAAQLLDLFAIPPNDADEARAARLARVNLNTAPREVLRTLIAGVPLRADPNQPANIFPARDIESGDRFAACILRLRQAGPLRSHSDLMIARPLDQPRNYNAPNRNTEPFLGSIEQYTPAGGTRPNSNWNDAGREELLRHLLSTTSFKSNRFRIVVVGQSLARDGSVRSTATREVHLTLEAVRDEDGNAETTVRPLIRKFHDRSL